MWGSGGLYPGTSKLAIDVKTDGGLISLGEPPSSDTPGLLLTLESGGLTRW